MIGKVSKPKSENRVFAIGPSSSGGCVYKEFEPEIDGVVRAWIVSDGYTQAHVDAVPRTLRIDPPRSGGTPEVIGWSTGPYIVCPQIRDWLDDLEPGVHNYIPIKVRSEVSIKGKKDHGTYYLILPPPLIDAVVIEKTAYAIPGVGARVGQEAYVKGGGYMSSGKDEPCVLRRANVQDRHLWRQPEGRGARYMCSADLWRRFREAKFRGWEIDKNCTLE